MSKHNATKKALMLSLLSMVLCVSMLVGSTFAWFTDTATTGVTKIQAGNLDVTLEMKDNAGNWVSAEGKTLQFKVNGVIPAEGTEIFWEPGCTYELPELRVVNNGNLALKYKVVISGINGSAKLNEVIDWTITLDGANYVLGSEHTLAAKDGETVDYDVLTIKGHMQETADNDYQKKTIEGIGITVYAVQASSEYDSNGNDYDKDADGTPQFDTWLDNVAATVTVNTEGETVLKDRDENPTITVTAPAGSTTATTLTVAKTSATTPANITVEAGNRVLSVDISLTDENGDKVTAAAGKFFTLTAQFEKNANVVGFYHNGVAMTKVASAEAVSAANDTYYYDATTGVVTFSTDDFSPFTVVNSDSDFNGGDGTEAHPYLIATGEQALAMEKAKGGNFKFIADVVVTDEIYLSGKTFVG